jgi:hypothetical protein
MPSRFQPCPDCGYAVQTGAPHCPDCGLILVQERSLFGRLLRRKGPTHHPDNLRVVDGRIAQELARLEAQLEHLQTTKASLEARVQVARSEGRSPAPLLEAMDGLEDAIVEAHGLIGRQRAVRAGIQVQRDHNEIRAFMDGIEAAAAHQGARRLLEDKPPARALPPTQERAALLGLCWSPCGRWLAGLTAADLLTGHTGQRLLFWDLQVEPAAMRSLEVPGHGACCLCFDVAGELLAVGRVGGLELLDCGRASWVAGVELHPSAGAAQVSCLCFGPQGDQLVVGTERGDLQRFSLARVGGEPQLRGGRPVEAVRGFPVRSLAIRPDGSKLFCSGGGALRLFWLRDGQLMGFSRREQAGAGSLSLDRRGERLAVAEQGFVAVYDDTISKQLGRVRVDQQVRSLRFAGDGERVALLAGSALLLGSPDARRVQALPGADGPPDAVAFSPDALRAALAGRDQDDHVDISIVDWGAGGLVGFSRKAMVGLEWAALEALRLRAEYRLDEIASFAIERNYDMHRQLQGMVRDAGLAAIYAVTRRAQAAEELTRSGGGADGELGFVARHLEGLLVDIEDLHAQIGRVLPLSPGLEPYLDKLRVLPVAALRGQADALMQAIEATLRGTQGAGEDQQRAALDVLGRLQAHAKALGDLANGLSGPFWGNPERPLLVDALRKLERDFPGWVDAVMARIASSAIGRIDAVEEHFGLDRLRDQRARIAGQAHGSGDVGVEADILLESALGHGPLGKEATEAERADNQASLDEEARRVDAETRAFLETQRVTRTL